MHLDPKFPMYARCILEFPMYARCILGGIEIIMSHLSFFHHVKCRVRSAGDNLRGVSSVGPIHDHHQIHRVNQVIMGHAHSGITSTNDLSKGDGLYWFGTGHDRIYVPVF